ncbi:MAG: Minf_1886 family protein [Verrucomicrobiota bacterium]|jgi:uncharacterized repeat protein (TIGR04138 family)
MQPLTFEQSVKKIIAADPRFDAEAYFFVREALDFTRRASGRPRNQVRDVSTSELLDGLRRYALETYGPMAVTVLAEWGVHRCEDFGEIVFNMIAHHCEGKSDTDSRDHFKSGYTFDDAFRKPFLPSPRAVAPPKAVEV